MLSHLHTDLKVRGTYSYKIKRKDNYRISTSNLARKGGAPTRSMDGIFHRLPNLIPYQSTSLSCERSRAL